ncbi:hypothetical protein K493DRAFT_251516 [Basidiobolus meristosporus CBS 931.73]|uniref:NADH2 dehydrogenase n=1 Tax=Basidiobolus meristosporus CBS 931.73 TaxID=1314790 RepID=A0A1Y1Z952_9FUNG|nr:hypothetical protein K493DRAFT_251516 [Basidiobolus meristosporus CBS 931.73]|eukprot:ORY06799.1 hypothetical protein K493DRAFT_251516 [Basidiobolus meristosporus CBS 931.73]
MFRTSTLLNVVKESTGLFGIAVHSNPRPHLINVYNQTLAVLDRLPSNAVYRHATTALIKQKLSFVENTENIAELESKLDAGQIEEVIMAAEDELKLAQKMEEWKAWEPLAVEPLDDQWVYPGRK